MANAPTKQRPCTRCAAALLALLTTLAAAQADAQILTPDGPTPEVLSLPTPAGDTAATEPSLEEALQPIDMSSDYSSEHMVLDGPALTESTGSWLRRGWWYSRVDVVAMVRRWNSDTLVLAVDPTLGSTLGGVGQPELRLGRSEPGREESLRFTLGRFLFRDTDNRDHTAEFTYFGGGQFGQNESLIADSAAGLFVPTAIDRGITVSFDGADSMSVSYANRFNSLEWNYVVTTRPRRDRMEMQPDGTWLRRMNEGVTTHTVFGLRYLQVNETFTWNATGEVVPGATAGVYGVDSGNYMLGPQFGAGAMKEWNRMSLAIEGKGSFLANWVTSRERLLYTNPTDPDNGFTGQRDNENTLPFMLEMGITGRWHLRPNFSFRAGYNLLFITQLALAPHQVNFEETDRAIATTGESVYHGVSMGFEGYW